MTIQIGMLRSFVEVARAGSLVHAAEVLGRTPSAISMTLKSFEEHLGRPLFETERKNRLTPLGRFTLEMAERQLAHYERTIRSLEDYASADEGEVRLAAVPSFATAVLPAIVASFTRSHPNIRLDIRDLDSATILRDLERERIDFGIVSDAKPRAGVISEQMARDVFGLFLRGDHPAAFRTSLPWQELEHFGLIASPLSERLDVPVLHLALSRARLRAHNTSTLLAMVREGLGVTVLPELVGRTKAPDIAFVPLIEPTLWRSVNLVRRSRDSLSPATAAFVAALREHASEGLALASAPK